MREPPPRLSQESLIAGLLARYGLAVAELTFLPLGNDAAAWVYQVRSSDGAEYFLKVRARLPSEAGLRVPHYLREQGITQIVAPLPTLTGELLASVAGYSLILYPFVAGTSGMRSGGLSERQWREYGAIVRRIHAITPPPQIERILQRERFAPASIEALKTVDAAVDTINPQPGDDPTGYALATFWRARRPEIHDVVARAEELGARLARVAPPFVISHGDMHTGNVQLDAQGRVWIVDWDETALAPKERDLMFMIGGIQADLVGPRAESWFLRGYGPTTVDPLALAYYRYIWAVQDIGAFGEQVLLMPDAGATTRDEGLRYFIDLFEPGSIVAIAHASNLTNTGG